MTAATARSLRRDPWLAALAVVLLVTVALLLFLGRDTTFLYDDWGYWRSTPDFSPEELLADYNGHASVVPKLLWSFTALVFGNDEYLPFRVGAALIHAGFLAGLYVVLARRIAKPLALAAIIPLTIMGAGWLTLLMPNTLHYFVLPLLWFVWAIVALDRGTKRGDVVACVLLVLSVFTSSSGLPPVAGAAAYLLWSRPEWRRGWIVAVPTVLYLLWYAATRPEQVGKTTLTDVTLIPGYVLEGLVQGLANVTTLGPEWGRPLAVLVVVVLLVRLARGDRLDRGLAAFVAAGVVFWALIAIGRGPEVGPATAQYLYANAAYAVGMLVLVCVAGLTLVDLRRAAIAGFVLAVAFAVPSLSNFRDNAARERAASQRVLAGLTAVNLLGRRAEEYEPAAILRDDPGLTSKQYLDALDRGYKPMGATAAELPSRPETFRASVDAALLGALGVEAEATEEENVGDTPPALEASTGAVRTEAGCHRADPAGGAPASVTVSADAPFLVEATGGAPVDIRLRRYADRFEGRPLASAREEPLIVTPPTDPGGWHLNAASASGLRVCGADPG